MPNGSDVERRIETAQALTKLTVAVESNTKKTDKVLGLLYDNGLVTQVALNKQSLGRLWKWTGSISAAFLGLAAWVLRGTFK